MLLEPEEYFSKARAINFKVAKSVSNAECEILQEIYPTKSTLFIWAQKCAFVPDAKSSGKSRTKGKTNIHRSFLIRGSTINCSN